MPTITFSVPGMTCGHCVAAVSGELAKVAGVVDVRVDLDSKAVVVTGDGVEPSALAAAVDEAGFEAAGLPT
ncbi:MAG: heavy-metal-associated domain-containing protein [Acidimicrobiales bacterium]